MCYFLGIDPEGSALHFSISGPVFTVDRETGVVRLRQSLDREALALVEVIISLTGENLYEIKIHVINLLCIFTNTR